MRLGDVSVGFFGFALWVALMCVLKYPHEWVTLTNAPVFLILVSSIYSLLLPLKISLALSAVAVLIFNYQMVPPIHTLHVDLHEHGILLITMMIVSWLVTYLLRRQKQIAAREHLLAGRTLQLMQWSEALREVDEPQTLLPRLHELVNQLAGKNAQLVVGFQQPMVPSEFKLCLLQLESFNACLAENKPLGNSTGRYENLKDLYLPMRGKHKAHGVCICTGAAAGFEEMPWVRDVQALLDQMGLACERKDSALRAQAARENAHNQEIRSLFLTSIAHDQRTPLASIVTSASAIVEQSEQLSKDEIVQHAELILAESEQVSRLTDNTLTLARLSGNKVQVPMQFESAEDMVAAVFQRLRQRKHGFAPAVKVEPGLPLLKCNMVLVEQVLDNLIDNAFKHSGASHTVELTVSLIAGQHTKEVIFTVRDFGKGMGVLPNLPGDQQRGLGIGLQLCRAVALIHGGRLEFLSQGAGVTASFTMPVGLGAG